MSFGYSFQMINARIISDPDAIAHVARMAINDSLTAFAINDLIVGLKAASLWSKINQLCVLHKNAADTVLNLTGGTDASIVGSPAFTEYRGFNAGSASDYINSNINARSDLTSQDNHLMVHQTNYSNATVSFRHGAYYSPLSEAFFLNYSATNIYPTLSASMTAYLQTVGGLSTPVYAGDRGFGFTCMSRESAALGHVQGDELQGSPRISSSLLPDYDIYIGARNTNAGVDYANASTVLGTGCWSLGSGFTLVEMETYRGLMEAYMTTIGAET